MRASFATSLTVSIAVTVRDGSTVDAVVVLPDQARLFGIAHESLGGGLRRFHVVLDRADERGPLEPDGGDNVGDGEKLLGRAAEAVPERRRTREGQRCGLLSVAQFERER